MPKWRNAAKSGHTAELEFKKKHFAGNFIAMKSNFNFNKILQNFNFQVENSFDEEEETKNVVSHSTSRWH